jgi:hypothetical protein
MSCVVEAVSTPGAVRWLCDAIGDARRDPEPFRHWLFRDLLPVELYRALRDLEAPPPATCDGSGRRETMNGTRLFFDPALREATPAVETLAAIFQDPNTVGELEFLTGAELAGTSLRIEYCLDTEGFWLEPHTDIAAKRFTLLIYLSDAPGAEAWGTDLLDGEGRLVDRPKAWPNSAVAFIPAADTWHGFAPRPIDGVRRTLIVNYVTADWRARHELAYPDAPVRSAWRADELELGEASC